MSIDTSGLGSNPSSMQGASSRQLPDLQSSGVTVQQVATVNDRNNAVQQSQAGVEVSAEKLQAAVEKMNELMKESDRSLQFSVDDTSEKVVIKVVDQQTDEVIRQIPSEETLKFSEFLQGMVGMIFDEKA
ncbi:flagellar protein FlaG [Marinobacterium sediminicola]|uniref:Flagellar protein FlaG n=1 Tax=Marinobacterium sediminicola TaxID=518898 RepID=A0ABY1RYD8_9GAMM|nr:flagellar protein FlaG [Marinobacterium sediminicola]ULG68790.1 flagellar protein FlaG [Marinobacterium sediminicola]SMR73319.1 flagellar protein FlaG [Marinobacterium sediminicola]